MHWYAGILHIHLGVSSLSRIENGSIGFHTPVMITDLSAPSVSFIFTVTIKYVHMQEKIGMWDRI